MATTVTSPLLISVIMPVYNSGLYLNAAIESILAQTYTNFEFLIFNDGSTDNCSEIIGSYTDSRIVFYDSNENKGYIHWLNYGLEIAKGELIARMDSDDIAVSTRFEKQVKIFSLFKNIGVCGSWVQPFSGGEKLQKWTYSENDSHIKTDLLFENPIAHPSVMMRRSLFDNFFFKYNPQYFPAEDYFLWYQLQEVTEFCNIPEVLLYYRMHSKQTSYSSEEQIEPTKKILKLCMLKSGLSLGNDIKKFEELILNPWQQTEAFLLESGTYLNELAFKNDGSGYFDKTYFRKKVQALFWKQCYFASKKNINGLKIYKSLMPDKYYNVPFLHTLIVYLKYKFGYTSKQNPLTSNEFKVFS
jgi:glycosyltransferase involved in cell wall biosynthesis